MNKTRHIVITALLAIIAITAQAQCKFRNTAFSSGEFLTYNLYYNWQFIWVKAGNASLSTIQTVYKGKPAYRASLTTRGSEKVDGMFILRDTLLCYSSTQMEPLYYRKGAREGKRYTVDEVFYSYQNNKCNIRQQTAHISGTRSRSLIVSTTCSTFSFGRAVSAWRGGKRDTSWTSP